jgi:uncharacterized protein with HEPN domain
MPVDIKDAARLNDIVKAAEAIASFINGQTEADYNANLLLRSAVERQVEIVGEAARALSQTFRAAHPEIPWKKIGATRNILAHDYGMIRNDILWQIASVHVPDLLAQVRPLVPPPPANDSKT